MAGLRSTYSFEKAGNNPRSNAMLKTEPVNVNAMLGLDESDDEEKETWGDVNTIQLLTTLSIYFRVISLQMQHSSTISSRMLHTTS